MLDNLFFAEINQKICSDHRVIASMKHKKQPIKSIICRFIEKLVA